MPVTLNIIESTTELGQEIVEVVIASASTPGPAGPGVPTGGTDGQVLTKASATDYDTAWEDPTGGGGGAPVDATYLVTTADGTLSNEVVVGATPGGELGGTWSAPTVDATHSGSSHAGVQAAAEATAAAALSAHEADTTGVHGIADTSALALTANHPTNAIFNDHSARHENGGADEISLAGLDGIPTELQTHLDDTTDAHDASAVSVDSTNLSGTAVHVQGSLEELDSLLDDHSARHEDGGADEISIQGLAGTPTELTNHLNDAADAHDASAISVLDSGANYTATDVEGVLAEIAPQLGAGGDLFQASVTSDATVSSTDINNPTTIISLGAQTYAAVPIWIEFSAPTWSAAASGSGDAAVIGVLVDSTTELCRVFDYRIRAAGAHNWGMGAISFRILITPSAGTHTYLVAGIKSGVFGNITFNAGDGTSGAGVYAPISLRAYLA